MRSGRVRAADPQLGRLGRPKALMARDRSASGPVAIGFSRYSGSRGGGGLSLEPPLCGVTTMVLPGP